MERKTPEALNRKEGAALEVVDSCWENYRCVYRDQVMTRDASLVHRLGLLHSPLASQHASASDPGIDRRNPADIWCLYKLCLAGVTLDQRSSRIGSDSQVACSYENDRSDASGMGATFAVSWLD